MSRLAHENPLLHAFRCMTRRAGMLPPTYVFKSFGSALMNGDKRCTRKPAESAPLSENLCGGSAMMTRKRTQESTYLWPTPEVVLLSVGPWPSRAPCTGSCRDAWQRHRSGVPKRTCPIQENQYQQFVCELRRQVRTRRGCHRPSNSKAGCRCIWREISFWK